MRLNTLESAGMEPLGQGDERKVFVDPENEERVISELNSEAQKDSPNALKARYYLTKILYMLLPDNIPDIYQTGEDGDGKQTIDRARAPHSPGQELLQKNRRLGDDEEAAKDLMISEMGSGMNDLVAQLADIGLGFNIDENVGNFTKDAKGKVQYLETFKAWEPDVAGSGKLEPLFDEQALRTAIEGIPDDTEKGQCLTYLNRLLKLKQDEEALSNLEPLKRECGPEVEAIESAISQFEDEASLKELFAIQTFEEAISNTRRQAARKALDDVFSRLVTVGRETNVTEEKLAELYTRRDRLSNAVGVVNKGIVDHAR